MPRLREVWAPSVEGALLVGLWFFWWSLIVHGLSPVPSDENIYFYDLREILRGSWPYRDFFFAHPPLHILFPAAALKLFGFSLGAAKLISPAVTAASAVLLWVLVRRWSGRWVALGSLGFFFTTHTALAGSTLFLGSECAMLWLLLGVSFLGLQRPRFAGVALAAAVGSALYALPAAAVLLVGVALRMPAVRSRLLMSFGLGVLLWHVPFLVVCPKAFLFGVYGAHILKAAAPFFPVLAATIYEHPHLWAGLLPTVVLAWKAADSWNRSARLLAVAAFGATVAAISVARQPWGYYFAPVYPGLAWLTAEAWAEGLRRLFKPTGRAPALLALGLLGLAWPLKDIAFYQAFPDQSEPSRVGTTRVYPWPDAPGPPLGSNFVRRLFWSERRTVGEVPSFVEAYLWRVSRRATVLQKAAEEIQRAGDPQGRVFGPTDLTPLLALFAERGIAGGEADLIAVRGSDAAADWAWRRALQDRDLHFVVSLDEPTLSRAFPTTADLTADAVFSQRFSPKFSWADESLYLGRRISLTLWLRNDRTGP